LMEKVVKLKGRQLPTPTETLITETLVVRLGIDPETPNEPSELLSRDLFGPKRRDFVGLR